MELAIIVMVISALGGGFCLGWLVRDGKVEQQESK